MQTGNVGTPTNSSIPYLFTNEESIMSFMTQARTPTYDQSKLRMGYFFPRETFERQAMSETIRPMFPTLPMPDYLPKENSVIVFGNAITPTPTVMVNPPMTDTQILALLETEW